jgi:hypothetical protein
MRPGIVQVDVMEPTEGEALEEEKKEVEEKDK